MSHAPWFYAANEPAPVGNATDQAADFESNAYYAQKLSWCVRPDLGDAHPLINAEPNSKRVARWLEAWQTAARIPANGLLDETTFEEMQRRNWLGSFDGDPHGEMDAAKTFILKGIIYPKDVYCPIPPPSTTPANPRAQTRAPYNVRSQAQTAVRPGRNLTTQAVQLAVPPPGVLWDDREQQPPPAPPPAPAPPQPAPKSASAYPLWPLAAAAVTLFAILGKNR